MVPLWHLSSWDVYFCHFHVLTLDCVLTYSLPLEKPLFPPDPVTIFQTHPLPLFPQKLQIESIFLFSFHYLFFFWNSLLGERWQTWNAWVRPRTDFHFLQRARLTVLRFPQTRPWVTEMDRDKLIDFLIGAAASLLPTSVRSPGDAPRTSQPNLLHRTPRCKSYLLYCGKLSPLQELILYSTKLCVHHKLSLTFHLSWHVSEESSTRIIYSYETKAAESTGHYFRVTKHQILLIPFN